MRRLFFSSACFLTIGLSAQINPFFEDWTGTDPDDWVSYNIFMPNGAPQSLFKDTITPGQGQISPRLITTYWNGGAAVIGTDTIPGYLQQYIPYSNMPTSIDFLFRNKVIGTDQSALYVQLTHWDGTQQVVDGYGWYLATTTLNQWTWLNMQVTYVTQDVPDTMLLIACSSASQLFGQGYGVTSIGSEMYIDSIVFNVPTTPTLGLVGGNGPTCFGDCDGDITLTVANGNPPYVYQWGVGSGSQTTATATGLCAGWHSCVVTDSLGGMDSIIIQMNNPPPVGGTPNVVNESSAGAMDGQVGANAWGGQSPYTYQWDDLGMQTGSTATGLSAGAYNCTITDINGCTGTITATVNIAIGVQQTPLLKPINVYPNPTSSQLFIEGEFSQPQFTLFSMDGRRVLQTEHRKMNLSQVATGTYALVITEEDRNVGWSRVNVIH